VREVAAAGVVRDFYAAVATEDYQAAWSRLGPAARAGMGTYDAWRAGFARTVSTEATQASGRARDLRGDVVDVEVALHAVDLDACSERVSQRFAGTWRLRREHGRWTAHSIAMRKVGGDAPITSASRCPGELPEDTTPDPPVAPDDAGADCDPNYEGACLDPSMEDYDCEGGSGDGPGYTTTVSVVGEDIYDLDRDGDGTGCDR
jgi:hypothetical protein